MSDAPAVVRVPTGEVVFRSDLYPRIEKSPRTVQQYAESIDVLPPIELNQRNELIDGWHRWTAHLKIEAPTVPATITETRSDAHLLELAIERNAAHGLQLSLEDKQSMARRIYHETPNRERDEKKRDLARVLSVSERTVRNWLSRIDKDTKEERDRLIFQLWLACHTVEEIAARVGVHKDTVSDVTLNCRNLENLPNSDKAAAEHVTDFDPPIYNVWRQQTKTAGVEHFGNSEVRWLDNLLYLYTRPFFVVVDPFAGSGSTIDLCRKRLRRYWVSDRLPVVERAEEIRRWDVTDGVPPLPRWKDVDLVYLDPPYWKQAEGRYSSDPADLANMAGPEFTETLTGLVVGFAKKLTTDTHIALIIQPTQWKAPDRQFTDHLGDLLRAVRLPVAMRYSVPYESQQCTAQMVEWAKDERQCLVLTREIVVWRVA